MEGMLHGARGVVIVEASWQFSQTPGIHPFLLRVCFVRESWPNPSIFSISCGCLHKQLKILTICLPKARHSIGHVAALNFKDCDVQHLTYKIAFCDGGQSGISTAVRYSCSSQARDGSIAQHSWMQEHACARRKLQTYDTPRNLLRGDILNQLVASEAIRVVRSTQTSQILRVAVRFVTSRRLCSYSVVGLCRPHEVLTPKI